MTNSPWDDPSVAEQQRALVDTQLAAETPALPVHAWREAFRFMNSGGSVLEYGCASGYGREILDRAGIPCRNYVGCDISGPALAIARERYPESSWLNEFRIQVAPRSFDIVADGCSLMHRTGDGEWQEALEKMAAASRRWLVLHRLPLGERTEAFETHGYGKTFPALRFAASDIDAECRRLGFKLACSGIQLGDGSVTVTYVRPRHYATYCDAAYWPRAKAMILSLRRFDSAAFIHLLGWDAETREAATALGCRVHKPPVDWLGGRYVDRTRAETMWTYGPQFLASVMSGTNEPVTYLDADLWFHGDPEPIFGEIGGARAGIVPHGFALASRGLPGPTIETHNQFGGYNVGLVHIADKGIADDWARRCADWCYDRVEWPSGTVGDGRPNYGDQGYLEYWPQMGAHVVTHPGACLGPWAVHTRALDVRGGIIHFGGRPLIAYHYSALKPGEQLTRPEYQLTARQASILYTPYLAAL